MPEPSLMVFLLSLITACLLTMTVTMLVTARDARRTLRRIDAVVPAVDRTLQEVRRAVQHVQQLLTRADGATRHVETVVRRACEAADEVVERFRTFNRGTEKLLGKWFGNGAGADPRRHHRSRLGS